ncbi:MAG: hypothetical protein BGO52_05555 [Sphingobacteriales bacterium 44-61]|nr:MAG: hypothetical protein BGO52_05555 [Sphingobacteriales bacterium 44-61]
MGRSGHYVIRASGSLLYNSIGSAKLSQNGEAWIEKQYFSNSLVFSIWDFLFPTMIFAGEVLFLQAVYL